MCVYVCKCVPNGCYNNVKKGVYLVLFRISKTKILVELKIKGRPDPVISGIRGVITT